MDGAVFQWYLGLGEIWVFKINNPSTALNPAEFLADNIQLSVDHEANEQVFDFCKL